jgi:hypothetical protein
MWSFTKSGVEERASAARVKTNGSVLDKFHVRIGFIVRYLSQEVKGFVLELKNG